MTPPSERTDATEEILELQQNWETFHETCDISLIEPHLADDVVYLPPEGPPIVGKETILERYSRPYDGSLDLSYNSQEINSDGGLAVNYHQVSGTRNDSEEAMIELKALDVFLRDFSGKWKLRWSIWNGWYHWNCRENPKTADPVDSYSRRDYRF